MSTLLRPRFSSWFAGRMKRHLIQDPDRLFLRDPVFICIIRRSLRDVLQDPVHIFGHLGVHSWRRSLSAVGGSERRHANQVEGRPPGLVHHERTARVALARVLTAGPAGAELRGPDGGAQGAVGACAGGSLHHGHVQGLQGVAGVADCWWRRGHTGVSGEVTQRSAERSHRGHTGVTQGSAEVTQGSTERSHRRWGNITKLAKYEKLPMDFKLFCIGRRQIDARESLPNFELIALVVQKLFRKTDGQFPLR